MSCEESMIRASSAGRNGLTSRVRSRSSRWRIWSSVSSSGTSTPRASSSSCRRVARISADASRKNLHCAVGNTSVPWSRPSVTRLRLPTIACCCRTISARTPGCCATREAASEIDGDRSATVMSTPSTSTAWSSKWICSRPAWSVTLTGSVVSMPASRQLCATARYIAPVSM